MSMTGTPSELISYLQDQPEDKLFTLGEHRQRRSPTANAYYWVLLNKLARKLGLSDTEVHRWMLRDYGQCDVFTVLEDVPLDGYFDYYETFGRGVLDGKSYAHVRVYKGSSKMDSAEFSRLLEGMRYECEQQGIEVMTPQEIAALKFVETYGKEEA